MIKFLANENFPLTSVKIIQSAGYDISYIAFNASGISDSEVMEIAIEEHRTILTFDRDYGELIFKRNYKPKSGVIYFRLQEFQPEEPGELILNIIKFYEIDFHGKLTVISYDSIRQKTYL